MRNKYIYHSIIFKKKFRDDQGKIIAWYSDTSSPQISSIASTERLLGHKKMPVMREKDRIVFSNPSVKYIFSLGTRSDEVEEGLKSLRDNNVN